VFVTTHEELLRRVVVSAGTFGGQPCVRGTRIPIAVILDGLAEGLSEADIIDHYPQLTREDIHGVLAYAGELARQNVWKVAAG
jgi:uncharacterized protein (DUF433 family)